MRWQDISYQLRPFEQLCKTCNNILVQVCFTFAWNNHQIVAGFYLGHKCRHNRLHLTTYAVALYRSAVLFADGKTHLGLRNVTFAVQHQKISVTYTFGVFVHVVVLIVFFKSVDRLQVVFLLLCGKLMTTLCATTCKNSAATGCLHSCSKTVHFASLSFLRLVSSFHFSFSFMSALVRLKLSFLNCFAHISAKAHSHEHSIHWYFNKTYIQSQVFGNFSAVGFAQFCVNIVYKHTNAPKMQ